MDKYITIKPWETNAPNHLEFRYNELIEITHKQPVNTEWKDWIWCHNSTNSGWIPKDLIEIVDENTGKMLENYSAKELSIGAGEVVNGYKEYGGWVWSQHIETGERGWLPFEILLKLSE